MALHHATRYRYDRPITLGPQVLRLRPAPHCRTSIPSYALAVTPEEHFINWQQDPAGNHVARVVFPSPTRKLELRVELIADLATINPFDFFVEESAEHFPFAYDEALGAELAPFLRTELPGPRLRAWLADVSREPKRTVDFLVDLNRRLKDDVRYVIRMEPGVQSCEETLERRSGSCRDTAWLLAQILRHLGLATRFASGYLIQLQADVKPLDGPAGPEADFTDLHAWTEVYVPGAGWIGLDATSGLLAGEGHIPLACAADPVNAAPITGALDECEVEFEHTMRVERIAAERRSTKPYSEVEWRDIMAAGDAVDRRLVAGDVRLTMGGEPTFVSLDDPDGDEWNTAAMGPAKLRLAGDLVRRLRARFAPSSLLHTGQGKWYPGEQLPRWALSCFWRRDGEPVWRHDAALAPDADLGHGEADAHRFVEALAERLGVDRAFAIRGYEDAWYHLWRERRLPVNVDPLESRLDDAVERARLARIFEQGLAAIVGYALPLAREHGGTQPGWTSGRWFLRSERMYLVPGDSPMGFRLPLDSLPWLAPAAREPFYDPDPLAARPPLPARSAATRAQPFIARRPLPDGRTSGLAERAGMVPPDDGIVRTAVCVEPRGGRLHVFMPPLRELADYLDLVAAVEDTAVALGLPVAVEGYPPPRDARLLWLSVTPDPGVIEVNVHPAESWGGLTDIVTGLYEDARAARLATEKFMVDGRHVGTGGGNHMALGGAMPWDSPFLRRPDLLRSLLAYWHNHPSLSFLFSGLFVGPTSQAPRVDQARDDSLHELELAFGEVERLAPSGDCLPWLVDRIFRNLLVDVTGNTHRAEFCIDKLYSPDSASGRLGLLELRGFEMPPDARMSLVQQLLVRALVARFWERPYPARLVRWGTMVHDRFFLPHFIWQDFQDVVHETVAAGFPLEAAWFEPHFEFRFPAIGTLARDGVVLELRHAIEPWHVLGEEAGGGGTVRYVDSSLERMQALVRGMIPTRHALLCNGQPVPLHPTGTMGEAVAAVRFRGWQPSHCLHPTVPVDTPLQFDLVDLWASRSIGRCTYHVAHPGGRHYEQRPVNAGEAEARRGALFFAFGHATDVSMPYPRPLDPEAPFTLDLRQPAR